MEKLPLAIALVLCAPILVSHAASAPKKIIALTFDDEIRKSIVFGNDGLIEILRQNHAPATFFVVGRQVKSSPEIFRALVRNGHKIENHSWKHDNLLKLSRRRGIQAVLNDIDAASAAVEEITGKRTLYFRPPYWASNAYLREKITEHGYIVMYLGNPDAYSGDCEDAIRGRTPEMLRERVERLIREREARGIYAHVLVFHEKRVTLAALKKLLPEFTTSGYNFVTVEEYFREIQAAAPIAQQK